MNDEAMINTELLTWDKCHRVTEYSEARTAFRTITNELMAKGMLAIATTHL